MHGLGSIAECIIFILGALQAEKLTKTSGACFAGHPVVYLNNWQVTSKGTPQNV